MAHKQLKLTYAIKDGNGISISEVEKGLKCGCICPACGEALVAKKGDKTMHHFAHYSGSNCEYGYESSLHLAAKEILSNVTEITIPAVYLVFSSTYKEKELISEPKVIKIDNVELEKRFDSIIPDIVVHSGKKKLFIEIFVTHRVDEDKIKRIKENGVSTIEIDLSAKETTITNEELKNILVNDSEEKYWIYNTIAEQKLQQFYKNAEFKECIHRGLAVHIDYCPLKMRVWRGKPYANYFDDCIYCEYCISADSNGGVHCTGKQLISKTSDFNTNYEERKALKEARKKEADDKAITDGLCPKCGWPLVTRQSDYGSFLGCSNYPYCKFKAIPDRTTGELIVKE